MILYYFKDTERLIDLNSMLSARQSGTCSLPRCFCKKSQLFWKESSKHWLLVLCLHVDVQQKQDRLKDEHASWTLNHVSIFENCNNAAPVDKLKRRAVLTWVSTQKKLPSTKHPLILIKVMQREKLSGTLGKLLTIQKIHTGKIKLDMTMQLCRTTSYLLNLLDASPSLV